MDVKLSFKERFCYSLGSLACNLLWTATSAFIIIFYTDIALIPAGVVGMIIGFSRILDAFSDIGLGILIDRGKSPQGKARPWLLRMAVPFGIAVFLCFNTSPDWPLGARIAYAAITFNLMSTFIYSSVDMPYGVLNAALTQDQYQRSVLNIFRLFMAIVAGAFINIAVPKMTAAFGGGAAGWRITFAIIGGISAILFILTYFNTKERVHASVRETDNVPLRIGFKALFMNKYWVMVLFYAVLSYTSSGLGGITAYFAREVLGDFGLVGTFSLIGVPAMLAGTFTLSPIVKRHGKRVAALIGIFLGIAGNLLLVAAGISMVTILVSVALKGLGSAYIIGTLFAMFADTIEYGEWKSGVRTAGLVYSASAFGANVGNGLGVAIVSAALSIGGYVARETFNNGPTGQSAQTIGAINFVYIWLPIILLACMALIMFFFKLDKEYPSILAELKARRDVNVQEEVGALS